MHRIELLSVGAVWVLRVYPRDPFDVVWVVTCSELKVPNTYSELESKISPVASIIGVIIGDGALVCESCDDRTFSD